MLCAVLLDVYSVYLCIEHLYLQYMYVVVDVNFN